MSIDLEKRRIPEWLPRWIDDNYHVDMAAKAMACNRCGMVVWAVTKHAHNVHGDDIPVLPPTPRHVADGLLSDEQGRLVRR